MNDKEIKQKLAHTRKKLEEKRKEQEKVGGPENCTYYGGWALGYLEGKLAVLEDFAEED